MVPVNVPEQVEIPLRLNFYFFVFFKYKKCILKILFVYVAQLNSGCFEK